MVKMLGHLFDRKLVPLLLAMALWPGVLVAQGPPAAARDTLQQEIVRLRAQMDSLRALVQQLQRQTAPPGVVQQVADPLAALRAAAEAAAQAAAEQAGVTVPVGRQAGQQAGGGQRFFGRERALQQLNPEITVGGDIFTVARQDAAGRDNFLIRELELIFQSTLDPYSRAVIALAYEGPNLSLWPHILADEAEREADIEEAAEEEGLEIEEAYAQWVNLPGGASLTVGRFRQRFGTYNRWHAHGLPWQELPLAYNVYLGEGGLAQTGASLYWLMPVHGLGSYQTWIEVTRSSNETLFGESRGPSFLAHVNAFWDISDATYFEIGLSGLAGRHEENGGESFSNGLLHLETGLSWTPPGRSLYRGLDFRAAVMRQRPVNGADALYGGFAGAEYRLGFRWLAGIRGDYVQLPGDDAEVAWAVAPTLTWWQSEFVRLRAEYNHFSRSDHRFGQLLLQMTFAMGPHKHDVY